MTKERILVRHARSTANNNERTSGDVTQIPLSEQGRLDAKHFAQSLQFEPPPELLVCSVNLRSLQTAEILQRLRFPKTPLETWEFTHEFHFLDFGAAQTTAADRKPMVDLYWEQCDPYREDPSTESWSEFYSRCLALNNRLAAHPAATILMVSHGYVMGALRTLIALDFPRVSPELMRLVHANQQANPIRNLEAFTLEYPAEESHL